MHAKECRICGSSFMAKTQRRELCDECQKDSTKAQSRINKSIELSKWRLGEAKSQQYIECICVNCGKSFHRYGRVASFCGTECSQDHAARNAKCLNCGKMLFPLGIVAKTGRGTCSETCAQEHRIKEARANNKAAFCKVCGQEFIQKKDWDDCCSKTCEKAFKWEEAKKAGLVSKCEICGKEYIAKSASGSSVCSTACYDTWRKLNNKPVVFSCVVCGKTFQKLSSSSQLTCCKECSEIRAKERLAAKQKEKREKAEKESREKRSRLNEEREKRVGMALANKLPKIEIKKLHLCTVCKTSQAECVFFTSNHIYHPKGAVTKAVGLVNVVLACPQYNT